MNRIFGALKFLCEKGLGKKQKRSYNKAALKMAISNKIIKYYA